MDLWRRKLEAGHIVLLDGGTGSELRRRGVPFSERAWSGLAPDTSAELLTEIHLDYIAAGAEIVTTSTFGTLRFVLEAAGAGERFETINRAAVAAALEARARTRNDIGIAGALSCMPPGFDVSAYPSPERESAAYRELADLFATLGVDLLLLEMLEDTTHAPRVCAAARASGLPFWAGLSCRRGAGGELVAFDDPGRPLAEILDAVLDYEPLGVNIMHTPLDAVGPALEAVRGRWSGWLGAYPEIAYREDPDAGDVASVSPEHFAEEAIGFAAAGARLLGGCCGTAPGHIEALKERLGR